MKAAIYNGPFAIELGERPDPTVQEPSDAVVRVVLGCVCGSDLWYYRGGSPHAPGPIGHEFIGVIEDVGSGVRSVTAGNLVVAPFTFSDGTCANCTAGWPSNCLHGGSFGNHGVDGGQGEAVRAPFADATLVKVPGWGHSDETMMSLLSLSDVMCTGHHAAVSAGVKQGDVVAVVGDGAVGLCAVIAAKRLGAERIIALSRNPLRQELARAFGATDVLAARGQEAIETVLELTGGIGVDAALECVGTGESMSTAFGVARVGSVVGAIGAPHGVEVPIDTVIFRNIGLRGGVAPVRRYIPELLPDVLHGAINPGRVFDFTTDLNGIVEAYTAMDERRAIKSLLRIGSA
jgi:threonine dehydrogenase-like Zn-dependent dehydrogenase